MASSLHHLGSNTLIGGDFSLKTIGIAWSTYHRSITEALLSGAMDTLIGAGISPSRITVSEVPGAFELPLGCQRLLKNHDAVLGLGCVIQGETRHFDFICEAVSYGMMRLSLDFGKPVGFGVLTTLNLEQAQARAGGSLGNKGIEVAQAVLAML